MQVSDAMSKLVKTVNVGSSIMEVAEIMRKNNIGSVIVLEGSGLLGGIITEGDVIKKVVALGADPKRVTVESVMTRDVIAIEPETTLEEAADIMTQHKIKRLPIVKEGAVIGMISATDLRAYEKSLITKVSEILTTSSIKDQGPLGNVGG